MTEVYDKITSYKEKIIQHFKKKWKMFEDPKFAAALLAGTVFLVVSGITGLYALMKNRKHFDH